MLNDKTYQFLKWFVAIVLPAATALVGTVGTSIGWANTDLCLTVMTAVTTFLGAILGVSNKMYYKKGDE